MRQAGAPEPCPGGPRIGLTVRRGRLPVGPNSCRANEEGLPEIRKPLLRQTVCPAVSECRLVHAFVHQQPVCRLQVVDIGLAGAEADHEQFAVALGRRLFADVHEGRVEGLHAVGMEPVGGEVAHLPESGGLDADILQLLRVVGQGETQGVHALQPAARDADLDRLARGVAALRGLHRDRPRHGVGRPAVGAAVRREAPLLRLYSDPESTELTKKLAARYHLAPEQVLVTNGSDEALNFAFMAFADEARPLAFADITYGFYPVFAQLNHIPYTQIPLKADFTLDPADYLNLGKTIVLANPNAPTGLPLKLCDLERILTSNAGTVVIVDEAYVDFGAESAVQLIDRYENLLVTQTFSKSRSLAGARVGYAMGNAALIADLNTIKYSTNPYNVSRLDAAAACAALDEDAYYMENCRTIAENRAWTMEQLQRLGFIVTASKSNFVFASTERISGLALYEALKARGILIRHFEKPRIRAYNRITVGTLAQMQALIDAITAILEEQT